MAITSAQALRQAVPHLRAMIADEKVPNSAGTQAGAAKITGAYTRVTLGGAGYSLVLPNLISNEAGSDFYVVGNETATTVVVFCALGDTMMGSANGSLTIAAGGIGLFVKRKRENFSYVAPDWVAAAAA